MLESGNFAEPRLAEEPPRFHPIGINWLEALAVKVAGSSLVSYRLPSLIGAIATVLLTWWAALAFGRPRAALIAGVLMAGSFLLAGEARVARPDAMFAATLTLSLGALARLWLQTDDRPDFGLAFLFWTGVGLATLLKGPIAPFAVSLTLVVLIIERGGFAWLRRLAPLPGVIWFALLILPGIVALIASAGSHFLPRPSAATLFDQQSFFIPPGSYILSFGAIFWPSALFAALAVPFVLDNTRRYVVFFCLAWALPGWTLVELIPGKLPHYILPVCPPIAILAAIAIDEGALLRKGWVAGSCGSACSSCPWWLAGVSLSNDAGEQPDRRARCCALRRQHRHRRDRLAVARDSAAAAAGAAVLSLIAAVIFYYAAFGVAVPNLAGFRTGERIVATANSVMTCADPKYAATGFREASLLIAGGASLDLTDAAGAADFIAGGGCRAALVEMGQQSTFGQRIEDLGLDVEVRGEVTGFNVGTVRYVTVRIVTLKGEGE